MAKEVTTSGPSGSAPLFNSALETGVRAVVVLDALHPPHLRPSPSNMV